MSETAICTVCKAPTALAKSADCSSGNSAQSVPRQRTGPAQSSVRLRSRTGMVRAVPQSQVSSNKKQIPRLSTAPSTHSDLMKPQAGSASRAMQSEG
jgi:hypothetical protein